MDINELIRRGLGNTRDLAAKAKGYSVSQSEQRATPEYSAFRASIKPRLQQIDFSEYMPVAGRLKGGAKAFRSAWDSDLIKKSMREFADDVFNHRVSLQADAWKRRLDAAAKARESMLAQKEALRKQMIRKRSMEPRGGILSWF